MEWGKVEKWIAYLDKIKKRPQRNEQTESSQSCVQSKMIEGTILELNLTFDKVWSVSVEVADWSGVGKRISGYEQAKDFNWTEGLMECLAFHISSMVT